MFFEVSHRFPSKAQAQATAVAEKLREAQVTFSWRVVLFRIHRRMIQKLRIQMLRAR
jgi:hypothetical protein